ncbi:MAG: hypothetical protein K2J77_07295 [Oscillospiraceae bacterium]|nr:hypothetical protein [Oscillospiraceae bacterium]
MSLTAVVFDSGDKKRTRDFLALPRRIYSAGELTQSPAEELALLNGTHILSRYFTVAPILIYRGKRAVSRAAVTFYPNDSTAYVGFFESENDSEAAALLFETAAETAAKNGGVKLTGPVDCSFWIKYRLKTNRFGIQNMSPYTGEPYNKEYYADLWYENGFEVIMRYTSNHYKIVENDDGCEKFAARLAEKLNAGYTIKSPDNETFDKTLREVYSLMIELYSSFPVFKRITEEDFCRLNDHLRHILNYSMVKMAYFEGAPVGFFISVPNYGNRVYGRLDPLKTLRILKEKRRPNSYVLPYLGVDKNHPGLGSAISEVVRRELKKQRVPSIGALYREGSLSKGYMRQIRDFEYEYVLLEKPI